MGLCHSKTNEETKRANNCKILTNKEKIVYPNAYIDPNFSIDLPNELLIAIFKYFSVEDLKRFYFKLHGIKPIFDYIIKKYDLDLEARNLQIKIPGSYIISRIKNNKIIEQYAYIDGKFKGKNGYLFEYHYGIMGYHEGICKLNEIRELNEEEIRHRESKSIMSLPHQFYHSDPLF